MTEALLAATSLRRCDHALSLVPVQTGLVFAYPNTVQAFCECSRSAGCAHGRNLAICAIAKAAIRWCPQIVECLAAKNKCALHVRNIIQRTHDIDIWFSKVVF